MYLSENPAKVYSQCLSRAQKVWPQVLDWILKIGQMQLLRIHIVHELSTSCKFESPNLFSVLDAFNKAVLLDVKKHYQDPKNPYPKEGSDLLPSLTQQLEAVGLSDPASKIYITTKNIQYFPLLAFLFSVSQMSKLQYSKTVGKCKLSK